MNGETKEITDIFIRELNNFKEDVFKPMSDAVVDIGKKVTEHSITLSEHGTQIDNVQASSLTNGKNIMWLLITIIGGLVCMTVAGYKF